MGFYCSKMTSKRNCIPALLRDIHILCHTEECLQESEIFWAQNIIITIDIAQE